MKQNTVSNDIPRDSEKYGDGGGVQRSTPTTQTLKNVLHIIDYT